MGYRVIPVNPFSAGKIINGENIVAKLEDTKIPIDVVNVFRPSKDVPVIAKQAVKIGAKVLWLQFGIQNQEAQEIAKSSNIIYIAKQMYKTGVSKIIFKNEARFSSSAIK